MRKTEVAIRGNKFEINSKFTYTERVWKDIEIEGLLFNTRMVQGIFDDKNPETVSKWVYPDTGSWDPDRNTDEFLQAMSSWYEHGVLCFTLNLQGGSPEGYSKEQLWNNSAFLSDGSLDGKYMLRLEKILDRADELGMVVLLGYFYFGQDYRLKDEAAVIKATRNATEWILNRGYRNVMIEVNNECNILYTHPILLSERIHELIRLVETININGRRLLVSASFSGGWIPSEKVVESSDFILIHGNEVHDPNRIEEMVKAVKNLKNYKNQPILFNEDDHFDFDKDINNMIKAIKSGASWGYFDPGASNYIDGYQCPPVNWGINTERKKAFYHLVKQITKG